MIVYVVVKSFVTLVDLDGNSITLYKNRLDTWIICMWVVIPLIICVCRQFGISSYRDVISTSIYFYIKKKFQKGPKTLVNGQVMTWNCQGGNLQGFFFYEMDKEKYWLLLIIRNLIDWLLKILKCGFWQIRLLNKFRIVEEERINEFKYKTIKRKEINEFNYKTIKF